MTEAAQLVVIDRGRMGYAEALALQHRLVAARQAGDQRDYLILVEHPPVVTLGRRADAGHLLLSREALAARGIDVHEIERGGDVTYHGPGQLVGYPIVNLKSHGLTIGGYLRLLEAAIIEALGGFGVQGFRREGLTGVWTAGGKVAAIGVAARRWITFHGFSLNVSTDLSAFDLIVPCGLAAERVTSMETLLGRPVDIHAAAEAVTDALARELRWTQPYP